MTPEKVDLFFLVLSRLYPHPLRAIVTGGTAAVLFGASGVTQDIDFELKVGRQPGQDPGSSPVDAAIEEARAQADIAVQYMEDWDRTSSIALPRKSPSPLAYKSFGRTRVFLMHPFPWAIGKLCRFLESDIGDLAAVYHLRHKPLKLLPEKAVEYWGRALGESPRSSEQQQFKIHVEEFLRSRGPEIWGPRLDLDKLLASFLAAARKASNSRG